ncbi:MAG: hypothetical protein RSC30_07460 [Oscillospiraceae bacterium]
MPYVQLTVKAGKTIEVFKYFSTRYGNSSTNRGLRDKQTPEQQIKVNRDHAERNLRWLINENFGENDIHLVATYKRENRPDIETALKQRRNMLRRFERVYEKSGLEFKYIAVTEYKNTAIHHHLIINRIDVSLLQEKWTFGKLRPTYLDDTGDYSELAAYLIKETDKTFQNSDSPIKKRWSSSKNLKKPKIKKQIIKASTWNKTPKEKKGYYIDKNSIYNGEHKFTGHPYQTYIMRRIE